MAEDRYTALQHGDFGGRTDEDCGNSEGGSEQGFGKEVTFDFKLTELIIRAGIKGKEKDCMSGIKEKTNNFNYKRYAAGYCIIALYIIIICVYTLIFRDQIYIPMHDCLDNNIAQYKLLHDTNSFFPKMLFFPFWVG